MEQNFISAMINAMTEELEKDGPNANILKERGRLKMLIGDKKGAMEDLRQAVSIDPSIVENINGEFRK
jgi:lipoprotein NlpI